MRRAPAHHANSRASRASAPLLSPSSCHDSKSDCTLAAHARRQTDSILHAASLRLIRAISTLRIYLQKSKGECLGETQAARQQWLRGHKGKAKKGRRGHSLSCGHAAVGMVARLLEAGRGSALVIFALLVRVAQLRALVRREPSLPPALIQRDEDMRTIIAKVQREPGVLHLLAGDLHLCERRTQRDRR